MPISGQARPSADAADGRLAAFGGWASRHRRLVLIVWIGALIGAAVAHRAVNSTYAGMLTIPSSPAQVGSKLLRADDSRADDQTGQLVFVDRSGLRAHASAIQSARDAVAKLPHVVSVSDPLDTATTAFDG